MLFQTASAVEAGCVALSHARGLLCPTTQSGRLKTQLRRSPRTAPVPFPPIMRTLFRRPQPSCFQPQRKRPEHDHHQHRNRPRPHHRPPHRPRPRLHRPRQTRRPRHHGRPQKHPSAANSKATPNCSTKPATKPCAAWPNRRTVPVRTPSSTSASPPPPSPPARPKILAYGTAVVLED